MNTDNTSISGETIDYGPCAFMDHYDPATVFSSIDEQGRYAYANQPRIALWNLTRLAECLLPLLSDEQDKAIAEAQAVLGEFRRDISTPPIRPACAASSACSPRAMAIAALAQDLLDAMAKNQADFTLTFRRLSDAAQDAGRRSRGPRNYSPIPPPMTNGRRAGGSGSATSRKMPPRGRPRCGRSIRPSFRRNHRIEAVIEAAVNRDDFAPFEELLTVLAKPYEDQPAFAAYAEPPEPHQRVLQTFCGT